MSERITLSTIQTVMMVILIQNDYTLKADSDVLNDDANRFFSLNADDNDSIFCKVKQSNVQKIPSSFPFMLCVLYLNSITSLTNYILQLTCSYSCSCSNSNLFLCVLVPYKLFLCQSIDTIEISPSPSFMAHFQLFKNITVYENLSLEL